MNYSRSLKLNNILHRNASCLPIESKFAVLRYKIDTEINRIAIRLTDMPVTGTRKYHYGNATDELVIHFFHSG